MAASRNDACLHFLLLVGVFGLAIDLARTDVQDRKFWKVFSSDTLMAGVNVTATGIPSLRRCAALCGSHEHCLSLGFQSASQRCWLYASYVPFNKSGVESVPGTRYYWSRQSRCPSELGYTFSSSYAVCYKAVTLDVDWFQMRDVCALDGAHLYIADSSLKFNLLGVIGLQVRLGASDEDVEDEWYWLNGRPVVEFWRSGYPRSTRDYNCISYSTSSYLYDGRCYFARDYLCEVPV